MEPQLSLTRTGDATLLLRFSGTWRLCRALPTAATVAREVEVAQPQHVAFEAAELPTWDSGLLSLGDVLGVRAGGPAWLPFPWRWAYGWDYCHGYGAHPANSR